MRELEFFAGNPSVLCVVAQTTGSCPGRTGFKMAVPPTGPPVGSVGGGGLEHSVIEHARELLSEEAASPVLRSFHHSAMAEPGESSGMICSGRQRIILVPHPPLNRMGDHARGLLVNPEGLRFLAAPPEEEGFSASGDSWSYRERLARPPVVYIFGGGHCSLALTPVLCSLGMRTVVIDDRERLWTMEENRLAWKKVRMDYSRAGSLVPDDGRALVVIMTSSHTGDAVILEQMLKKDLRYLGMMASRATAAHILSLMAGKGFTEERLRTVHTPVGIPISSHTPAEIAVSIAGEIIQELNRSGLE